MVDDNNDNNDNTSNIEELEKAAHYWKDKDPAKYKKMLAKLKRERKTPGHKERAQQQILQAKRRERGGKGTTAGQNGKKGHSGGRMKGNHGAAVKRYQSSEKKAGTKLSPDRKDNNKGYTAGNVRNIPQRLNVGRHKADEKKVSSWRKKLKKYNIELQDFVTLLQARALETNREELAKALDVLDIERVEELLEKWIKDGNSYKPEANDPDGDPHPEKGHYVKHTTKIGKPANRYSDEVAKQHEKEFSQNLEKFKSNNEHYNSNPKFAALVDKLVDHVTNDPDRHVIASGTTHEWDGNKQKDGRRLLSPYKEPRLRHLRNALGHSNNIRPHPEGGIELRAERHSSNKGAPDVTRWHVLSDGEDGIKIKSHHTDGRTGNVQIGNFHDTEKAARKRVASSRK